LSAQDVDVGELGELLRCEGLGGTERHVTGVMNPDVESAVVRDDLPDTRLHRLS